MSLRNNIIADAAGGVVILVALMFGVLLSVVGLAVDVGRIYVVQAKIQSSVDAALLGAVATASTTNVTTEAVRLFLANYPVNYMGTSYQSANITQVSPGQYLATVSVTVPSAIMQVFGNGSLPLNITTRVNVGYQLGSPQKLELALVLDNALGANAPAEASAGIALRNVIFGSSNSLSNVRFHILPYDVDIDIGNNRVGWIQSAFTARYNLYRALAGGGRGFISNRNGDNPAETVHQDVSDVAPTTDATRFRVPYGYNVAGLYNPGGNPDYVSTNKLTRMHFGLNTKSSIQNALNSMQNTNGRRRINVGLMWGWFALSPNWQGLWSASLPGLPAATNPLVSKQIILVVSGKNNVYTGIGGQSNDDKTTHQLCDAVKARGITLYTVGFGVAGSYDATLLQYCASAPGYYYTATTAAQLKTVFQQIADAVQKDTLHISQ